MSGVRDTRLVVSPVISFAQNLGVCQVLPRAPALRPVPGALTRIGYGVIARPTSLTCEVPQRPHRGPRGLARARAFAPAHRAPPRTLRRSTHQGGVRRVDWHAGRHTVPSGPARRRRAPCIVPDGAHQGRTRYHKAANGLRVLPAARPFP